MSRLESSPSGDAHQEMGATEDEVVRDKRVVAPEVTDMGIDELGRDHPDKAEFGRGEMPDQPSDATGAAQPGQTEARPAPDTGLPYPRRPTVTDLPTGGGAGGPRPHLNPQLDRIPGEAGKEGSP